jgi:hypothetical protein
MNEKKRCRGKQVEKIKKENKEEIKCSTATVLEKGGLFQRALTGRLEIIIMG